MEQELEKVVDSVATETQPATQTPSPAPEGSNEGNQETQEASKTVDWEKRYSDSSRENSRISSEMKELQSEFLSFVTRDRGTFEQYVSSKGLAPEENKYWMDYYDTQIAPSSAPKVTEDTQTPTQPVTPPVNPIRESWMRDMDRQVLAKREERATAAEEFWTKPENKSLPENVATSINALAFALDEEYNFAPNEALMEARRRILSPEAIQEEGYAQGVKDSMTGGFTRGFSGGSEKGDTKDKLPSKEEAFVQSEVSRKGLNEEQEKVLRKQIAERLALRS